MDEVWAPIDGFPSYSVSSHGRVRNEDFDREIGVRPNNDGIPMVSLRQDLRQHVRSVKVLVAQTFLAKTHWVWTGDGRLIEVPVSEFSTTPIQIDGDQSNCRVDNLAWRPRWFAWKYTQQFRQVTFRHNIGPVVEVHTGDRYDSVFSAAVDNALLVVGPGSVWRCLIEEYPAFPTNQYFERIT